MILKQTALNQLTEDQQVEILETLKDVQIKVEDCLNSIKETGRFYKFNYHL